MNTVDENDLLDEIDAEARMLLSGMLEDGRTTVWIQNRYKFNRGLIPFVLNGGHSPTVLRALGLPVYERREVPVCAKCGEVHTMHKTCDEKRQPRVRFRKSASMRSREEQRALDRVALDNGFVDSRGRASFTEMCRFMAEQKLKGHSIVVDSD